MKINFHSLSFKVFMVVWITITLFAVAPVIFMLFSSDDTRNHFYNKAIRTYNHKAVMAIVKASEEKDTAEVKSIREEFENTTKSILYVFTRDKKEVTSREYPEIIDSFMNEMMKGDKVVLIKKLDSKINGRGTARVYSFRDHIIVNFVGNEKSNKLILFMLGHYFHSFVLLLIVASAVSVILVRSITKPINKLSEASKKVAEGNFSVRIPVKNRKDEVGTLAKDFNKMTLNLERAKDNQEEMLRNISHELRSPLTRLRLSLELARSKSGEGAQKALDRIEKESERLNEMIESLLEISRIKVVNELKVEELSFKEIMKPVISNSSFEAESCGIRLIHDIKDYNLSCNKELLTSAVENVIRNSIKYAKSEVVIKSEISDSCLTLTISDDGTGVSEEHIDNIFTPFYRVQQDRDRKTGGTGLGLAITRAVLQAHNGKAYAENNEKSGLSVILKIPV
jgi:two-component system sensor histidine kinase CpxA